MRAGRRLGDGRHVVVGVVKCIADGLSAVVFVLIVVLLVVVVIGVLVFIVLLLIVVAIGIVTVVFAAASLCFGGGRGRRRRGRGRGGGRLGRVVVPGRHPGSKDLFKNVIGSCAEKRGKVPRNEPVTGKGDLIDISLTRRFHSTGLASFHSLRRLDPRRTKYLQDLQQE